MSFWDEYKKRQEEEERRWLDDRGRPRSMDIEELRPKPARPAQPRRLPPPRKDPLGGCCGCLVSWFLMPVIAMVIALPFFLLGFHERLYDWLVSDVMEVDFALPPDIDETDEGRLRLNIIAGEHGARNASTPHEMKIEQVAYIVAFLDHKYGYQASGGYSNGTAREYLENLMSLVGRFVLADPNDSDLFIDYGGIRLSEDLQGELNKALVRFRARQGPRPDREDIIPAETRRALQAELQN